MLICIGWYARHGESLGMKVSRNLKSSINRAKTIMLSTTVCITCENEALDYVALESHLGHVVYRGNDALVAFEVEIGAVDTPQDQHPDAAGSESSSETKAVLISVHQFRSAKNAIPTKKTTCLKRRKRREAKY